MSFVNAGTASLYCRDIGSGSPIIVVHGGPDFDHAYLLPDLDRLADAYRLIYYDQRGRGRSQGKLDLAAMAIEQCVSDLDHVRKACARGKATILGHSWGAFVALHYALHHPGEVSHLILLNPVSASNDDLQAMRRERQRRWEPRRKEMDALSSSAKFEAGDPETVAAYYRLDFGTALAPEHLPRLRLEWPREDILRGRGIEDRLAEGLYWQPGYSLLPELHAIRAPTLVIHGEDDFFPLESSAHIAEAIPGAKLEVIPGSGHFSYIDAPEAMRRAIDQFMAGA